MKRLLAVYVLAMTYPLDFDKARFGENLVDDPIVADAEAVRALEPGELL